MRSALVLAMVLVAAPAMAADGILTGASSIFVWRTEEALDEGAALVKAGADKSNPAAIIARLSCIVPDGTRATSSGGFRAGFMGRIGVLVTDGQQAGCKGVVPLHLFKVSR